MARKNRERVVAVETERVEKDRMLEVIARERETELQRIDKDKAVEQQKREIADVIRERVAVEKTVAEQEEAIKKVRVVEEAERVKQATVISAEAEAQEKAAEHYGREQLVLAEAKLKASNMHAKVKIRMSDGARAEHAAIGPAEVEVKEADAVATERLTPWRSGLCASLSKRRSARRFLPLVARHRRLQTSFAWSGAASA